MTAQVIDLASRRKPSPVLVTASPRVVSSRVVSEDALVERFLTMHSGTTPGAYRRDVGHYRSWLTEVGGYGIDLYQAEDWHVADWKAYMLEVEEWATSTVRRRMTAVGGLYQYAMQNGLHDRNPEYAVKRPKVGSNVQYTGLELRQIQRLVAWLREHADERTRAVCFVLLSTGVRVSELCNAWASGLHWSGDQLKLHVIRKGGKQDVVTIPPQSRDALFTYLGSRSSGPLFLGDRGGPLARQVVWRMVRRVGNAALPELSDRLHPHDFRHSLVSAVVHVTGSRDKAQEMAGHSDGRTTQRYVHALEVQESTVAADVEALLGLV